jgi:hypothetical protein
MANLSLGILAANIEGWHEARNLIKGSTDQAQYVKLIEEAGELAGNIARGKNVGDDIGDMVVVLINIARRNGLTLEDCVQTAWDDIKNRTGQVIDGVYVKEEGPLPLGATHTNQDGSFLKYGDSGNFWCIFVDDAWKVMSGEPVGEIHAV